MTKNKKFENVEVGKSNNQQENIESDVLEAAEATGDSRTPRETRRNNDRADTQRTKAWQPPSVLPDPKPQDGYVFRYKNFYYRSSRQSKCFL